MKKRIITIMLCMVMAFSFSACKKEEGKKETKETIVEETKPTVESVLNKVNENDANTRSARFEVQSSQEFASAADKEDVISYAMQLSGKYNKDSKTFYLTLDIRDRNSNQIAKLSSYTQEVSDKETDLYYQVNDAKWVKVTLPAAIFSESQKKEENSDEESEDENSSKLKSKLKALSQLSPDVVSKNGASCYEILTYVNKKSALELLKLCGSSYDMFNGILQDDSDLTVRMYIDSESYELKEIQCNIEHIDISQIITVITGSPINFYGIALEHLNADITISDNNKVDSFSVPDNITGQVTKAE